MHRIHARAATGTSAARRRWPAVRHLAPYCPATPWSRVPDIWRRSADIRRGSAGRSEEHTSELQSPYDLVCRLLLEEKNSPTPHSPPTPPPSTPSSTPLPYTTLFRSDVNAPDTCSSRDGYIRRQAAMACRSPSRAVLSSNTVEPRARHLATIGRHPTRLSG